MALSRNKKKIDVIDKLLEACYQHNKDALFIMSLMHQYEERGSLSRKQLEGLILKAKKIKDIPIGWVAAVEAIVMKMPVRDKTPIDTTINKAMVSEEKWMQLIEKILEKYPEHKRVLYLKAQWNQKKIFSGAEQQEIEKFYHLLVVKKK